MDNNIAYPLQDQKGFAGALTHVYIFSAQRIDSGNKKLHSDHVRSLKTKLLEYNVDPIASGPATCLPTSEEIDPDITRGLVDAERMGHEKNRDFVEGRLVVASKLSIFNRIKLTKLKTGRDKCKKVAKEVSILKEDTQAFGLIVEKPAKVEDAFSYPITLFPLIIATPDSGLFQTDKAGFRNLILKQSDEVRKDYPKNAKWIIDGMTAIRSVKPRNTYEEWFLALTNYMKPPRCVRPTPPPFWCKCPFFIEEKKLN